MTELPLPLQVQKPTIKDVAAYIAVKAPGIHLFQILAQAQWPSLADGPILTFWSSLTTTAGIALRVASKAGAFGQEALLFHTATFLNFNNIN